MLIAKHHEEHKLNAKILPPMFRFSKDRATKKETVLAGLCEFFERLRDLI